LQQENTGPRGDTANGCSGGDARAAQPARAQPHDPHCQALTQADPCYLQWITASVKDALSSAGVGAFFNLMNFGQMLLWPVVLIRSR
jgi:hypothetical protein